MFRFKCYPDGGDEFEVVARSRAITAWENAPGRPKGSRRSISDLKDLQMTDYVDLAWFAATKQEQTGLDITEWRDQVDVEFEKYDDDDAADDPEAGPTRKAL